MTPRSTYHRHKSTSRQQVVTLLTALTTRPEQEADMAGNSVHEQWRPIPSTSGTYEASNTGRIRRSAPSCVPNQSYAGRIIKPRKEKNGYMRVGLHREPSRVTWHFVHRLVCEAFYGPSAGMYVNHKNGRKDDNRPENLEWVTAKQNAQHASRNGLLPSGSNHWTHLTPEKITTVCGEQHGHAKLADADVRAIRIQYAAGGVTQKQLASRYGVDQSCISNVVTRRNWATV